MAKKQKLEAKVFLNPYENPDGRVEVWVNNALCVSFAPDADAARLYFKLKELQNQGYKITFGM